MDRGGTAVGGGDAQWRAKVKGNGLQIGLEFERHLRGCLRMRAWEGRRAAWRGSLSLRVLDVLVDRVLLLLGSDVHAGGEGFGSGGGDWRL